MPRRRCSALQSGEVDTQVTSQIALLTPIENNPDFTIDKVSGTGVTVFTLRVDTAPFDKKNVRQAIATALDRNAINDTLVQRHRRRSATTTCSHPPIPASPTDIAQRDIDLDKVKELLGRRATSASSSRSSRRPRTTRS